MTMSDVDKEKQVSNAADQVQSSSLLFERGLLSEFKASVLQPNTSGATVIPIPITPTTTTLASLTGATAMHVDDLTDRIWLSATVGWTAVTLATVGRVDVLFKFGAMLLVVHLSSAPWTVQTLLQARRPVSHM